MGAGDDVRGDGASVWSQPPETVALSPAAERPKGHRQSSESAIRFSSSANASGLFRFARNSARNRSRRARRFRACVRMRDIYPPRIKRPREQRAAVAGMTGTRTAEGGRPLVDFFSSNRLYDGRSSVVSSPSAMLFYVLASSGRTEGMQFSTYLIGEMTVMAFLGNSWELFQAERFGFPGRTAKPKGLPRFRAKSGIPLTPLTRLNAASN